MPQTSLVLLIEGASLCSYQIIDNVTRPIPLTVQSVLPRQNQWIGALHGIIFSWLSPGVAPDEGVGEVGEAVITRHKHAVSDVFTDLLIFGGLELFSIVFIIMVVRRMQLQLVISREKINWSAGA